MDESPPLEQPKSSLSDGDYVVIVEEVKSTIQARYTTCYVPELFYSFFFILPMFNLFSATHGDSQA